MGLTRADFALADTLTQLEGFNLRENTIAKTLEDQNYNILTIDLGGAIPLNNGLFANPQDGFTAKDFGVVADGVSDDYAAMVKLITRVKNIVTDFRSKLPPTTFENRNVNITVDFGNLPIALSQTLTLDGCDGVRFKNATFYPHSSYVGTDPLLYAFQTSSLKFEGITFQCDFVCSGFHFEECPLFEVDGVSIYGCGKQPYGMRFSPAAYSVSGKISHCNVFGWPSFHNQLLPVDRTSRNIWVQNNDVAISHTNSAAGLVCMDIDGEGVQIDNCHVWNGYPSDHTLVNTTKPLGIRSLSSGHVLISNSYIDNSVIWVYGKDKTITDNFYISAGDLTIDTAIVIEPISAGSTAQDMVITGNRARGQYQKMVEVVNNGKSFSASSNVLITNNIRKNTSGGAKGVESTIGMIKVFVTAGDFDVNNKITVDVSDFVAIPDSNQVMLATVGIRLLSDLTSDIYSSWVFYDNVTKQLKVKFNTTFSGDVFIRFDQSGSLETVNPL